MKERSLAVAALILGWILAFPLPALSADVQQKLIPRGGLPGDWFGRSVAVSGDTALVGAQMDDTAAGVDAGSVRVFTRSTGVWTEQTRLVASDAAAGDLFGTSIAMSADTALIGAFRADASAGAAYVFVRIGDDWIQQAKLTASDASPDDWFGMSVGLSGDTAIVGAPSDDNSGGVGAGAAYVFVRSAGIWTQRAKLVAQDGADNDFFGRAVAVSDETAVVGMLHDDVDALFDAGSAYVFLRVGDVWIERAKILAADRAAQDRFGSSVAIEDDTIVIGAGLDDTTAGQDADSAYVYMLAGTAWIQLAKLIAPSGRANDVFGGTVAISQERIAVAAPLADIGPTVDIGIAVVEGGWLDSGAVYLFSRPEHAYTGTITAGLGNESGWFGQAIAIDGDTLIGGAPRTASDVGAAYICTVAEVGSCLLGTVHS